jgi:hypothetical protein
MLDVHKSTIFMNQLTQHSRLLAVFGQCCFFTSRRTSKLFYTSANSLSGELVQAKWFCGHTHLQLQWPAQVLTSFLYLPHLLRFNMRYSCHSISCFSSAACGYLLTHVNAYQYGIHLGAFCLSICQNQSIIKNTRLRCVIHDAHFEKIISFGKILNLNIKGKILSFGKKKLNLNKLIERTKR